MACPIPAPVADGMLCFFHSRYLAAVTTMSDEHFPVPEQVGAAMRIIRASFYFWIVTSHAGKVPTGGR